MIFFENERSKVRTLRASFQEIARIFATLGGFNLGWYWLSTVILLARGFNMSLVEFLDDDIFCSVELDVDK